MARVVRETHKLGEARTYRGTMVVARDLNENGAKRYTVYDDGLLALRENEHAYEHLFHDQPRRIYVDMEWPGKHPHTVDEVMSSMRRAMNDFLCQVPTTRTAIEDVQVASASGQIAATKKGPWAGQYKHSYHLRYRLQDDRVVRDAEQMKLLWTLFVAFVEERHYEALRYDVPGKEGEQKKWVFDVATTSSNQCWRMLYQSKFGSDRVLRPFEGSSEDPTEHIVGLPLYQPVPEERFLVLPGDRAKDDVARAGRKRSAAHFLGGGAFPHEEVERLLLSVQPRETYRQLCLVSVDGQWNKKKFLVHDGGDSLRTLLGAAEPAELHVGPWRHMPHKSALAMGRELTFDLDLPDYDRRHRRRCACRGSKQACAKCWLYAEYAMVALDTMLRELFNYQRIAFYFSGSKGFHCWVRDGHACALNDQQRTALLALLTQALGGGLYDTRPDLAQRFYESTVLPWSAALFAQMPEVRRYVDEQVRQRPATHPCRFHYEALVPVFDAKITTQIEHNIKVPWMVHPRSGRLAEPLNLPGKPFAHKALLFPS